ncbi:MAG: hypothetical protein JST24_01925 [Acidobacteria bacterium]|nr:hypothetical protein [Acidobacteriota bacterium]
MFRRLSPSAVLLLLVGAIPAYGAKNAAFVVPPTTQAIRSIRVFQDPLVPVSGVPSDAENGALARAIERYHAAGKTEAVEPFTTFLEGHPDSPWRASLEANLGMTYFHGGYFTRALKVWDDALARTLGVAGSEAAAVRVRALQELIDLNARLGRVPRLKELLTLIKKDPIPGWAEESVTGAEEGLDLMEHHPERAYRCGPLGLAMIKRAMKQPFEKMYEEDCTPHGTSLAHNEDLATKYDLDFQMAKRAPGAPLLMPALVHWKAGHFAALIKRVDDRYLVEDPTFGDEFWVSEKALDDELSGYALVKQGPLPKGWRKVSAGEGQKVWGRGSTGDASKGNTTLCDNQSGGAASSCDGKGGGKCGIPGEKAFPGMPNYTFHTGVVSLHVADTPIGYAPPVGPSVYFSIVYNQREVRRGQWVDYANLGPQWTNNWDSYMVDDPGPAPGAQSLAVYASGGGSLSYSGYNTATATWNPQPKTHESLAANQDRQHPVYTRNLIDGTKLIYATPDGATTYPRRVYLTQVVDPQGNAVTLGYDSVYPVCQFGAVSYGYMSSGPAPSGGGVPYASAGLPGGLALSTITDALGQVTRIQRDGLLRIKEVDDPFGRSAHFGYNDYSDLTSVTDEAGITSTFTYGYVYDQTKDQTPQGSRLEVAWVGTGDGYGGCAPVSIQVNQVALPDFLATMTTPYGTTHFDMWESGTQRVITATDPLGNTERLEFLHNAPGILGSDPLPPTGVDNIYLQWRNSFYWDKRVWATYGHDYTKAHIYHWLHGLDGEFNTPVLEGEKNTLDRRLWYGHDGGYSYYNPTEAHPTAVKQLLPDGSTQAWNYTYNAQGKPTKIVDPMGRTMTYLYSTDGLDLLEVHNTTAGTDDLLAKYTYNAQHRPLTATDASGQTTTMTYNGQGQLLSATNPKGQTTTYTYNGGYLRGIQGPTTGSTVHFGYDGSGRVSTVTDSEGRTVTTAYDALDRPTRVEYPDGTNERFYYSALDLVKTVDRKGLITVLDYNALRQMTDVLDSLGRKTHFDWCSCGSLEAMTDPAGHITTWFRDVEGRVLNKVYADRTQSSYAYDAVGRLQSRTDAMGQMTAYAYGVDNSLSRVDYFNAREATPSVTYSYDARYPRLATVTDGYGTTTFAYNPIGATPQLGAGRLASVQGPWRNDTISYLYDELGRVVSRTLNGSTEQRGFDALGRLTAVTNPLGAFSYAYEGDTSRLSSVTAPNGMTSSFTYAEAPGDKRLQSITHKKGDGTPISAFAYTYDADGQIATWAQSTDAQAPKTYTFSYDAVGQILGAQLTGPTGELIHQYAYAYDAAGNRTSEQVDGAEIASDFNAVNQMTQRHYSSGSQAQAFRARQLQSRQGKSKGQKAQKAPSPTVEATPAAR